MHVKEILVYLMLVGAAALELTGCDSFWRFFRDARGAWWLLLGVGAFAGYGFVQTLQPLNFGRVYAMYGGIFVVMSIVWGALFALTYWLLRRRTRVRHRAPARS